MREFVPIDESAAGQSLTLAHRDSLRFRAVMEALLARSEAQFHRGNSSAVTYSDAFDLAEDSDRRTHLHLDSKPTLESG